MKKVTITFIISLILTFGLSSVAYADHSDSPSNEFNQAAKDSFNFFIPLIVEEDGADWAVNVEDITDQNGNITASLGTPFTGYSVITDSSLTDKESLSSQLTELNEWYYPVLDENGTVVQLITVALDQDGQIGTAEGLLYSVDEIVLMSEKAKDSSGKLILESYIEGSSYAMMVYENDSVEEVFLIKNSSFEDLDSAKDAAIASEDVINSIVEYEEYAESLSAEDLIFGSSFPATSFIELIGDIIIECLP